MGNTDGSEIPNAEEGVFQQGRKLDLQGDNLCLQFIVLVPVVVDPQNRDLFVLLIQRIQFGNFLNTGLAPLCPIVDHNPASCIFAFIQGGNGIALLWRIGSTAAGHQKPLAAELALCSFLVHLRQAGVEQVALIDTLLPQ